MSIIAGVAGARIGRGEASASLATGALLAALVVVLGPPRNSAGRGVGGNSGSVRSEHCFQ